MTTIATSIVGNDRVCDASNGTIVPDTATGSCEIPREGGIDDVDDRSITVNTPAPACRIIRECTIRDESDYSTIIDYTTTIGTISR